ncbi:MAG: hypothetical protein AB7O62_09860 [Pirellulales bacterium]
MPVFVRKCAQRGSVWLALVSGLAAIAAMLASGRAQEESEPDEALHSLRITIEVGNEGEPLAEAIDVHLGIGAPLRLFPLGAVQRGPGLAVIPQKSSLSPGVTSVEPGSKATFEFLADPEASPGADELRVTPGLLAELRTRDLQSIGFASLGRTDWVLLGYTVEANGRPLASRSNLKLHPQAIQRGNQAQLQTLLSEFQLDIEEISGLDGMVRNGLATDEELLRVQALREKTEAAARDINLLSARLAGALPWYLESPEHFTPPTLEGDRIESLEVTITTLDLPNAGSRNPVYLWLAGHKFMLSSEADPLGVEPEPQTFVVTPAEMQLNPVLVDEVKQIGIGISPHDEPQTTPPDRMRLKRIVVRANDRLLYDSDRFPRERAEIRQLVWVPTSARDPQGVANAVPERGRRQVALWKSGSILTGEEAEDDPDGTESEPLPPDDNEEPSPSDDLASDPQDQPDPAGDPEIGPGPFPLDPPPPVFVDAPFDPYSMNAPRRRRRRLPDSPSLTINVNSPSIPSVPVANAPNKKRNKRNPSATPAIANSPAGQPANRPVTPTPAPAAPVLANIRINPSISILRDKDQATVNWRVSGDSSNVSSYRVDLFGVLPHKNPPLIGTPLATQTNIPPSAGGSTQTMLARPPAIAVSNIQAQLTGADAHYLYVQPKVTALAADGTALVSGFGSILPLFPAESTSPHAAVILPGQVFSQGQLVAAQAPPPSFQVLPNNGAPAPWKSSFTADPQASSSAWPLNTEQDSSFALTFANYIPLVGAAGQPAYSAAARPASGSERIAIQYEGVVPIPANLATPAKGWRVVGHVAFLGGNAPATASVQTRVNVSVRPASTVPFLTMQTPQPIVYQKFAAGQTPAPCLLIDMPIRYDLMASNNMAASPHDATKYAITTFTAKGGAQGNSHAWLGRTAAGPVSYVSVTFMIGLQATDPTDAVGVFGLRLVPDNN